jgi:cbb3-type cytochrome oxidase maturation protein
MNVLVYLVPLALGLGLTGLFAFLWALRSGQYSARWRSLARVVG